MSRAARREHTSLGFVTTALFISLVVPRAAAELPLGLWDFDPLYSESPRNSSLRPSIAKDAFTDKSILPWQILGILGGYVFFTLLLFIALFTCGRRWRRSAQASSGALSLEMVKPNRWMGDASPAVKSISSFKKWGRNSNSNTPIERSPISAGAATFDQAIVQSHKEKQELDMERIYAEVLKDDYKSPRSVRSASVKSASTKGDEVAATTHGHARTLSNSSRSFSQRRPPQLKAQDSLPNSPGSPPPASPPPNAALYPPYGPMPSDPNAPVFSVKDAMAHAQERTASPRSFQSHHTRQASDTSIRSKATLVSITSPPPRGRKSKTTRSARNLTISAPMPTNKYPGDGADDEEARTPLTPREFGNPKSPDTPHGQHRPVTPIEDHSNAEDSAPDDYDYDGLDRRRPLPSAAPQRNKGAYDPKSPPPLPPPPQDLQGNAAASASTNTLPFRAYATGNAGPSGSTRSSATVTATSPTKTTMISPRRDRLPTKSKKSHGHPLGFVGMTPTTGRSMGGLYSAGLATGPMTPYSPYMPFSPVTPVTPRLTTRDDRRAKKREEGRKAACAEEDAVKDEKEIWGGSW